MLKVRAAAGTVRLALDLRRVCVCLWPSCGSTRGAESGVGTDALDAVVACACRRQAAAGSSAVDPLRVCSTGLCVLRGRDCCNVDCKLYLGTRTSHAHRVCAWIGRIAARVVRGSSTFGEWMVV